MQFLNFALPAVLILLTLTACSTAPNAAAVGGSAEPVNLADGPRKVTTVIAGMKTLEDVAVVNGTLAAEQEIVLGMKVAGRVAEMLVDLGSSVDKGGVIARLDTTDFELRVLQSEAALQQARVRLGLPPNGTSENVVLEEIPQARQARAQMDGAKARLDRALQLTEKGLLAKSDLDALSSAYKVTEAQYSDALDEGRNRQGILAQRRSELEIARQQLADAVLYAPIAGMIRQRNASQGQYIAAGAPVATLVQMNPLRLRTDVPEREARYIRTGLSVRVTLEGTPGVHTGRVVRISPSFDETNRTLLVETEVMNNANVLRPGAFARAEIVTSSGQPALLVPQAALVTFAGVDRVFAIKDGKAWEKRVATGRRLAGEIEILEGIEAGERIIVNPGNLADGEAISEEAAVD